MKIPIPFDVKQSQLATNELIETAFMLIEQGAPTLSPESIHRWLETEEGCPFPCARMP